MQRRWAVVAAMGTKAAVSAAVAAAAAPPETLLEKAEVDSLQGAASYNVDDTGATAEPIPVQSGKEHWSACFTCPRAHMRALWLAA